MQVAGGGQVGGDEPVAEPVLEWLRHLRRREQQDRGEQQQAERRQRGAHPTKRAQAEVAQRHDLEELDSRHGCDGQEPDPEHARI